MRYSKGMKKYKVTANIDKDDASLPGFFKPILWSYDLSKINPYKDKKRIIVNAINYGDLKHWKWIGAYYGQKTIQEVLGGVSVSEIRPRVLKLASLVFSIKSFNHAPRGVK